MREARVAQASIFDAYSEHQYGVQLQQLSSVLDQYPQILPLVSNDLIDEAATPTGRTGMSVESVFRCLLLKQRLQVSYEQLAFHLSDSLSYRTFARLPHKLMPSRSGLQSTIRKIKPQTLAKINKLLSQDWHNQGVLSIRQIRMDATVVTSNIAPPSDSQLLNDGVRVLSRLLVKSREITGVKIRFTDQRKRSKSLAFQIFNAKKQVKNALYPELLRVVSVVLKQVSRGLDIVNGSNSGADIKKSWVKDVAHFRSLILKVVDQTERRVLKNENVHSSEKIVSLFEEHTDIIVKGFRDVQYGHKINLCTEKNGFITHLSIEKGNPADSDLFFPALESHKLVYNCVPKSVVSDGCYASQNNVKKGHEAGVKQVVFNKPVGLSLHDMGVKSKTFTKLRNFRAGIEGNISEFKRAYGAKKATWKGLDGFEAFVWASTLTYNLMHYTRLAL